MNTEQKNAHAAEARRFAEHEFIEDVLTEYAINMNFERKGLPEYGLKKIVHYVAQVVLARARGFEPEVLTMTDEEHHAYSLRLADAFLDAGKPVIITDGNMTVNIDPEKDR
jgi:hypothetical protein